MISLPLLCSIGLNGAFLGTLRLFHSMLPDKLVAKWFCVHAFANLIVTITAFPSLISAISDPANSVTIPITFDSFYPLSTNTIWPVCMINAVHLYHALYFDLDKNDKFHHFMFVPTIGLIGQYFQGGASANAIAFFISGFPGMLDYIGLILYKQGNFRVSRETQKWFCSKVNIWCRCPMLLLSCFCFYSGFRYGDYSQMYAIPAALTIILASFNALYYADSSIRSHERTISN